MYDFNDFYGYDAVAAGVRAMIKNKKFPQSVIIEGTSGSGKTLLAKSIAKTLLCRNGAENASPCNECLSCVSFDSSNNPDVFYVDTDKSRLGIDDIRDKIVKNTETAPYLYEYKVFIVKGAHTMTAAAQNSLLKTIEEPKQYGIFLLLGEYSSSFLPTVLSRCVLLKLKPLTKEKVEQYLLNTGVDKKTAAISAVYSAGSIGRGKFLCQNESFLQLKNQISDMLKSMEANKIKGTAGSLTDAFYMASFLINQKENIEDIFNILEIRYRDMLVFKETASPRLVLEPNFDGEIETGSAKYTLAELCDILEAIRSARESLAQNGNFNMTAETLMLAVFGY